MKQRPFKQVDVFTPVPYRGNPLAVVLDGTGLAEEAMQRFTNWTNLSEATFVLPATTPGADYRVRIFTSGRELPFAGHPTLGTCHAWLQAGGRPKGEQVVQECGVGLVKLKRDGERLAFAAPPLLRSGPLANEDVELIARGLGIPRADILHHAWCDNGPHWRGVMLRSAEQVLSLRPDGAALAGLDVGVVGPRGKVGVIGARGASDPDDECAFEVRAFFPGNSGMAEDPVTGSLNAALAQWLIGSNLAPARYVAAQGTALGRAGRVHVERDEAGDIWVGGASVTCVEGSVLL
ncbi:MAG TPA: PhzF family phenazine biosynthesis protein [Ramlibacter sp.]|uniref:PhzF family phenazine biosynthesis protein n=1 Tax=Ramlibacter sp. TaxID=1917967 RepID=UPI002B9778F1|nr:PhzF family phenazine biosynthesis protein [Ramlibacter sp.]HVZ44124.1 PhzF family phenazine biosynthesis protein [Ramlibacter sp.]